MKKPPGQNDQEAVVDETITLCREIVFQKTIVHIVLSSQCAILGLDDLDDKKRENFSGDGFVKNLTDAQEPVQVFWQESALRFAGRQSYCSHPMYPALQFLR